MRTGKHPLLLKTLLAFYVFLRRRLGGGSLSSYHSHRSFVRGSSPQRSSSSSSSLQLDGGDDEVIICSLEHGLLSCSSTFPYFMLVALESGSLWRALLLLLLYPLLRLLLREDAGTRVMTMVCFRGVEVEQFREGRAVLPKHLLESVSVEGFQRLAADGGGGKTKTKTKKKKKRKVCVVTGMPRVMVEAALKEYLRVDVVVAKELAVAGGRYTGHILEEDGGAEGPAGELLAGDERDMPGGRKLTRKPQPLPKNRYPEPLVFHDGRIAFRPTAAATVAMFVWLPLGLLLALIRAVVHFCFSYEFSIPILAFTGMTNRLVSSPFTPTPGDGDGDGDGTRRRGRMFACNHRTLLDPLYVSGALRKPVTAVTYSLSRVSEVLSPIRTVRLTRRREEDRRKMEEELSRGDLVVCPEGTTCREPYLLRFSPLFAEVAPEGIVPVALDTRVSMFHGTTAGGRKWLDPFFFAMDPFPSYTVEFLEEVRVAEKADGARRSKYDVANQIQRELAGALGFQCTMLNRKDKYLMLAGNEGLVNGRN